MGIMVCYAETVIGNHDVNAVPVSVNHGEIWSASGCESWRVTLIQWLRIMLCYAEPVVVNHDVLC